MTQADALRNWIKPKSGAKRSAAFGTVGLSVNFTADLSMIGKLLIIVTMMLGKLGPLTLLFSFAQAEPPKIGYPHEDVVIG